MKAKQAKCCGTRRYFDRYRVREFGSGSTYTEEKCLVGTENPGLIKVCKKYKEKRDG